MYSNSRLGIYFLNTGRFRTGFVVTLLPVNGARSDSSLNEAFLTSSSTCDSRHRLPIMDPLLCPGKTPGEGDACSCCAHSDSGCWELE